MATPIAIGVGVAATAAAARFGFRAFQRYQASGGAAGASSLKKYHKGGFDAKMNKREASLILGLRESGLTQKKLKEAHRRVMLANHPDRGGSPFIATKINEAKELLEKTARK
ncbi:MAG: hypothetical protein DHS80DRAFT_21888 [Piptocephalis tieghemiana]|nr:MAG: hypothetical protein DHS80DRAFT_21888 [Piptocephalis tieghemiana]